MVLRARGHVRARPCGGMGVGKMLAASIGIGATLITSCFQVLELHATAPGLRLWDAICLVRQEATGDELGRLLSS